MFSELIKNKKINKKILKISSSILGLSAISIAIATSSICKTDKSDQKNISVDKNNCNLNSYIRYSSKSDVYKDVSKMLFNTINSFSKLFVNNCSKQKELTYPEKIIIEDKANKIVKEIYSGKVNINSLSKESIMNVNNLPLEQKKYLKQEENESKNKLKISLLHNLQKLKTNSLYPSLYSSKNDSVENTFSIIEAQEMNMKKLDEFQTKLKTFAEALTGLAVAATAIAAAEWAVFIFGWAAAACTTTAMIADWTTVGISWNLYNKENSDLNNFFAATSAVTSATLSGTSDIYSIYQDIKNTINLIKGWKIPLRGAIFAAMAANGLDVWANPGAEFVNLILDTMGLTIDVAMTVVGIMDMSL